MDIAWCPAPWHLGTTPSCMSMRALVLLCSLDQNWTVFTFKALVPQCYLRCLEGLARAATSWVSNSIVLEPRGGRGWMIHFPIFTVENLEARQVIKSQKSQSLGSSVSHGIFHVLLNRNKILNILLWFWTGIPGFCWKRENKKEKKFCRKKQIPDFITDLWSQMTWT